MICQECGMGYIPECPDDVKPHDKYHDKIVNGIYAAKIKSDNILWEEVETRITIVNCLSHHAQKKRAEDAGLVTLHDTPFDFAPYHSCEPPDERDVHIFLLYKRNRIIGFLLVERRDHVKRFLWEDYKSAGGQELLKTNPIWSIGLIWIHRKHGKAGLGSQLIRLAASCFNIDTHSIGWYVPFTDDGEKLAKKLCPICFFVAM